MTDQALNDFVAHGTTTQRLAHVPSPPTPAVGPPNGYVFWDDTLQQLFAYNFATSAWVAVGGGGGGGGNVYDAPFTQLNVTGYAWTNQGSGVITSNANGTVNMSAPSTSSDSAHIFAKALAGIPYTVTAVLKPLLFEVDNMSVGMVIQDTVSGKILTYTLVANHTATPYEQVQILTWTNPTGSISNLATINMALGQNRWYQISNDGTTRTFSISVDGDNFVPLFSHAAGTFLTENAIGFLANSSHSIPFPSSMSILSFTGN